MANSGENLSFKEARPLPIYNTNWGMGWFAEGARGSMAPDPATVAPRPMVERALAQTFGVESPVIYSGKFPVSQDTNDLE